MNPRKIALFIIVDLLTLLLLLLFLSYYGLSHVFIIAMGIFFLVVTFIDLKSGVFSSMFSKFMSLDESDQLSAIRWLPVMLSLLLLYLGLPVFFEHGFINTTQRWAIQNGQLIRIALPAMGGGLVIIVATLWTLHEGSKKKRGN